MAELIPKKPIDVSILVLPESEPGPALGAHDALWSVGILWNQVNGLPVEPVFSPKIVATSTDIMQTSTGARVQANRTVKETAETDIILLPSLLTQFDEAFDERNAELCDWLNDQHAKGAHILSSCTGAYLLASAGLLDGCLATTHWAFTQHLAERYPSIRVTGDRILVPADDRAQIVTVGGATSWTDLVLYITGRFAGPEEAQRLAKINLFDWHHSGQNPYAQIMTKPQMADATIRSVQEWVADHYAMPEIVTEMVRRSGLNSKTFSRRFRAATSHSALDYVQRIRVEEAKQLIETSDMPIDQISETVGYRDCPSFIRIFRKLVGETPAAYRKRVTPIRGFE